MTRSADTWFCRGVGLGVTASLALLVVLVRQPVGRAPSSQCELIKDHDERFLCRALTSGDELYCEGIKDEGRRQLCRAEVR
jgi:hypothetical protein